MKKLAVCTVGVVLALLLGGASMTQSHAAVINNSNMTSLMSLIKPDLGKSQGVILDLAWITSWTINKKKLVFIPVPHSDVPWQPQVMNPMQPAEKLATPENLVRRSLWFMPIGRKMLWGTLLDDTKPLLVFAERLTKDDYRITVESLQGDTIITTEGTLRRLDEKLGYGVIESKQGGEDFIVLDGGCSVRCHMRCRGFLFTLLCVCDLECDLECPSPEP
jgi:hypothetical protein